jgi:hypothetical protein
MHDITNTIRVLEEVAKAVLRNQALFSENEARLAKNMESHLALTDELRAAVRALVETKSTQPAGTSHPTQPTIPAPAIPSSVPVTARASDCVHGWTVEKVLDNYSKHVTCGECPRYNSCSTLNQAYEFSTKQK